MSRTLASLPGIEIQEEKGGYITNCTSVGQRPTDANVFAVGCLLLDLSDGKQYYNAGTVASPSWNATADITTTDLGDGQVTAAKLASTLDLSGKTVTLAAGEVSAGELASTLDLSGKSVTLATGEVSASELASALDLTGKDIKFSPKSGTPVNAVAASKTLTISGDVLEGETITIGSSVYEIDSDGVVSGSNIAVDVSGGASAAGGTLTMSGVGIDGETATINGRVYELDADSSITGDVTVDISGGTKVQSTGTLTLTGTVADGETITVGTEVYEIDTDGVVSGSNIAVDVSSFATASQGTLTLGGSAPSNNETITVGTQTYTWKTTLTGAADEIKIGSTVDDCIDNFVYAVNAGIGAGTLYGTGTVANADATAEKSSGTEAVLTAIIPGVAGDSIATTETMGDLANIFDDTTLGTTTAGADCTAANADGVIISAFNGGTALEVTAAQGAGTTVDFSADAAGALDGSVGNSVATTYTTANASFGNTTLTGGSDATGAEVATAIINAITGDGSAEVTAASGGAGVVDVTAKEEGTGPNSYVLAETLANGAWGAGTLSGGSDEGAADAVTAIVNAITGDGGAVVSAVDGTGDTVVCTALTKGTSGNSIVIGETLSNGSWGGGAVNLSGGVDGTVGAEREMYVDTSYLYIATAANTVADTNWRRIDLGSAY